MIRTSLLFLIFACTSCTPASSQYRITVSAGDVDRIQSVVSFDIPSDAGMEPYELQPESGNSLPVQMRDQKGWFILDRLGAGETRTYTLRTRKSDYPHIIEASEENGAVTFEWQEGTILTYNASPTDLPHTDIDPVYTRGGYIHPVYTPSQTLVTNDYPPNHVHHHGIWAAWTNTVFQGRTPDFWNMGGGTGTVVPVALDESWSGPVMAGFSSRHRYVDLSDNEPVDALNETWEARIYAVDAQPAYRLFDLRLIHTTAGDSALKLPEYRYGGLGFRGHGDWEGPENTFFLTSEGKDRSNGHATTARWCHIGGYVGDKLAGVAILGHPDNFRAPQNMRIHPTEPFFNWAPSQAGDWAISPDQPYDATYRFVVMDGPPNVELLERLWTDFADPVEVRIATQ